MQLSNLPKPPLATRIYDRMSHYAHYQIRTRARYHFHALRALTWKERGVYVRNKCGNIEKRLAERITKRQSQSPNPKRYRSSDMGSAPYALLSANPPIFYVAHWMDEQLMFLASLDMVFEYLRDRPAYFLYAWYWYIED